MVRLATRILQVVKRFERYGAALRTFTYYLCQDETDAGNKYLYVKCIERLHTKGGDRETFAVAGGCGTDSRSILRSWKKICSSESPIHAIHLADLVSDESLGRRFTYAKQTDVRRKDQLQLIAIVKESHLGDPEPTSNFTS
ncbi:MAG TPA: hypothetical protein GX507_04035 [Clostridia bacterium]|nr:hypothetical protein [Clostridia bacterium]